jgi:hypothetical protein
MEPETIHLQQGKIHETGPNGKDSGNDIPLASGAGMMADVWWKWRVATDSSPVQETTDSTKPSTRNK